MSDYREQPQNTAALYSLFLIGKTQALTLELMTQLYQAALAGRTILSLERLFKGSKRALVVFGPRQLLHQHKETLGLVELEDYSRIVKGEISAWEMSRKNNDKKAETINFAVPLMEGEECWWQLVLQSVPGSEPAFKSTIRMVVKAADKNAVQSLQEKLSEAFNKAGLILMPQAYSSQQLVKFYQERSLPVVPASKGEDLILDLSEVPHLLSL